MQEEKEKRELPGALKTLAGVAIVFLLLAAVYVFYQAMQVLFPPNTYETALLATVEDTVDAEGVLLFNESYVAGDGTLGYLVADGERVSAGTAVAEVYSDASQAGPAPAADPDQRPDRPAAKIAEPPPRRRWSPCAKTARRRCTI